MSATTDTTQPRRAQHALERLYERYGVSFEVDQIDWICGQIQTPQESDRDFKKVCVGIDGKELWKVNIGLLLEDDLWICCVYDRIRNNIVTVLSWEQGRQAARKMRAHRAKMEQRAKRMASYEARNRRVLEDFCRRTGRTVPLPFSLN